MNWLIILTEMIIVLGIGYLMGLGIAKWRLKRLVKKLTKNVPLDMDKQIEKYKEEESKYLKEREVKQNGRQKSGLVARSSEGKDREITEDDYGKSRTNGNSSRELTNETAELSGESEEERDIQNEFVGESREFEERNKFYKPESL